MTQEQRDFVLVTARMWHYEIIIEIKHNYYTLSYPPRQIIRGEDESKFLGRALVFVYSLQSRGYSLHLL